MQSQSQSSASIEYRPLADYFDETVFPAGGARPVWQPLSERFQQMGLNELARKWREAKQIIRENGVTYNVYGNLDGMVRPWKLDPIPHLIGPEESRLLEAGLVQRARLLNAILVDLYGRQELLHRRIVPPELILGHPGFLRPCHGWKVPGQRFLHLYAADIGRTPDGRFWVLSDRTQAPSGAGYALENRIVLSRMLSESFRDFRVHRLALFFRSLRDSLRSTAPHNRDNPRIVLLTPGPLNETYFEHAYLARYLGYTLVEGSDLTVRDNRVYMKVLGGLQPVDVILRRLDDDFCDPLELKADSYLGVPGLVQAVRAGNVTIANALGSGLVETPALMPFLPSMCRFLLREELKIPSIATWWCGQQTALRHVLANLPNLVIKAIHKTRHIDPWFGNRMNPTQLAELARQIERRPENFVAQERLPLSTAPVLVDHRLEPRHIVLRTYLVADGDGYTMMPGGLTRVTKEADSMVVSMQAGGGSKDTWFLSDSPVSTFTMLAPTARPVELSRGGSDLPSRAADNLYWLGRYAERADGKARLLRGVLVRLTEKTGLAEVSELPTLMRVLSTVSVSAAHEIKTPTSFDERSLREVIFDHRKPGTLAASLLAVQKTAGTIRDRISTDMWRVLSGLPETLKPDAALSDILDIVNHQISTLAAFGGLAMESMTRSHGWRFLDMGRRLERALHSMRLLDCALSQTSANESVMLEAVLEIADSLMTYRRRYLSSLQVAPVLDLLLADESNPRSLAFQLVSLMDDVASLPRDATLPGRTPEDRIMLSSLTMLRLSDIEALTAANGEGRRTELHELLAHLEQSLWSLSDAITQHYLIHLQRSRHLAI